jgi:PPOX class probable F420-dependent enzyme
MDLANALEFAASRSHAVLTTLRRDGRPQLSNVMFAAVDSEFWISLTDSRAKTKNLRRDPRAVLYVPGDDFWNYVVLDRTVTLTDVAAEPGDEVVAQLVDYYRRGAGEHPDWDDFRATMVSEGRMLAKFRATTAYGLLQSH